MAKFRTKSLGATKTTNKEGAEAYSESPELELVSLLLTSFVSDKFYETAGEQLTRLSGLVSSISDKMFVGQAAVYARNEFGMRSITHALIGELIKQVKGEKWLKYAIAKTVRRPDDLLEMFGYYGNAYGKPFPNSLKKGARLALANFDAYQLAKYRGAKSSVKMIDVFNLVHPKPTKEQKALFENLMKGELKSTDTWESKLTQAGKDVQEIEVPETKEQKLAENKAEAWGELIKSKKLGYFALLRNLRNILEQAPEVLDDALALLVDKPSIKKSLVLPFRFATAAAEIEKVSGTGVRKTIKAINEALEISMDNVPELPGKTLVALDESGSMSGKPIEIGSLFAAILYKANDADLLTFSDVARFRNFNPGDATLSIAERLQKDFKNSGTNFNSIFDTIKEKYDRIIILSDMQAWMSGGWDDSNPKTAFRMYKNQTGANPHIYSFDLNGYGTLQFPEAQVYCIAGFSEKILEVMKYLEKDRKALINEIKKVKLVAKGD